MLSISMSRQLGRDWMPCSEKLDTITFADEMSHPASVRVQEKVTEGEL